MVDVSEPAGAPSVPDAPFTSSKSDLGAHDGSLPSPLGNPVPRQLSYSPSFLHRYASTTDQSLVRLRRLLTTAAGLETFLSTVNYALYILAYLEARSPSRSALLHRFFKLASSQPRVSQNPVSQLEPAQTNPQPAASLERLGSLISDTRITLRLTALLPLYTWLQELLAGNESQDRYLRTISLIQCMSYIIYQFAENVAFLADRGIVSRKWLEKRGGSGKWWLWSSRAWLAGVSCDFLRLFREALVEREKRVALRRTNEGKTEAEIEKQREIDRMWWSELFVASCWLPLCLHYSLEDGLKGVNNGIVGVLGFMAGAQRFMAQWAKTQPT